VSLIKSESNISTHFTSLSSFFLVNVPQQNTMLIQVNTDITLHIPIFNIKLEKNTFTVMPLSTARDLDKEKQTV